jgi:hypothetical protein
MLSSELRWHRSAAVLQLAKVRQDEAGLRQRLNEMNVDAKDQKSAWPAVQAADALAAELILQNLLITLARSHGITPLNFGGAPVPVKVANPAVAFSFEFETGHTTAVGFVEALELHEPAVGLYGVWIRQLPVGALGETETPVSVRLTLWSFWKPQLAELEH